MSIYCTFEEMSPVENIIDWAKGYNIPGVVVDGQDVIAVAEAALVAIEHARSGKGPYMIEAKTVRLSCHATGFPDLLHYEPRPQEMIDKLKERDPIKICQERLLAEGILTQAMVEEIHEASAKEIEEAERFAEESPVCDQLDFSDINKLIYA
jgi:pyruvate dehydrogenase E1 component alpha subunit